MYVCCAGDVVVTRCSLTRPWCVCARCDYLVDKLADYILKKATEGGCGNASSGDGQGLHTLCSLCSVHALGLRSTRRLQRYQRTRVAGRAITTWFFIITTVCACVCVLDPADLPHHRHVLLAGCTFASAQGAASCVAHAWLTSVCHASLFQCPCGECQAAQYNLRCLRFPHHCPSTTAAVAAPTDALQGVSDEVASSLRGFLARMQSHETPVSNDLDFCLDGTCGSSYVGCCLAVRAVWLPFAAAAATATASASLTHCARFVLHVVPVMNSCGVPACDRADACPISARVMRRRHAMCAPWRS